MKFEPETAEGGNLVTRLERGRVWVAGTPYERSVIVPWAGAVLEWAALQGGEPGEHDFGCLAALDPEVVIYGSGARLRFPRPAALRPLIERRIGVETMDTAAACRTFNVLVSERRRVVGAFVIDAG